MSYSDIVLDHFHSPRRVGVLKNDKSSVKTGIAGGLHSGKVVRLQVLFNALNRIEDTAFKAQGCVATLACGSWLAEQLIGKSFDEIKQINGMIIGNALGLPSEKMHCALLAETALCAIIQKIEEER